MVKCGPGTYLIDGICEKNQDTRGPMEQEPSVDVITGPAELIAVDLEGPEPTLFDHVSGNIMAIIWKIEELLSNIFV